MADPVTLGVTAVAWAVTTAASGALSGAGDAVRVRAQERLQRLLQRVRQRDRSDAEMAPVEAPSTHAGRVALAQEVLEGTERHPDFRSELATVVRELELVRQSVGAAPAVPAVAPAASTPQLLPPRNPHFTDRDEIVARVARLLDRADQQYGPPPVVLTGPSGIGKSALAEHLAHLLTDRLPDPPLYANLRGDTPARGVDPAAVRRRFLRWLGLPDDQVAADPELQAEQYQSAIAQQRRLILLDNAHNYPQVYPLLPAGSGSLALITTRHPQTAVRLVSDLGAETIEVGPLSAGDSLRLLSHKVGAERVERHRHHALSIATWSRGVPHAIAHLGAQAAVLADRGLEVVAQQLSDADGGASKRAAPAGPAGPCGGTGKEPPESATGGQAASERQAASVVSGGPAASGPASGGQLGDDEGADEVADLATDLGYARTTAPAARLYRALGMFPWPDVPLPAAAAAIEAGEPETRELLDELAGLLLIEEGQHGRFRLPDGVRRHAAERARQEDGYGEHAAVARHMTDWYLRFAARADHRAMPMRWRLGPLAEQVRREYEKDRREGRVRPDEGRRALVELSAERENLDQAVRIAEEYHLDDRAWQLCQAMWSLHLKLGFYEQWVATHRLGVAAARRDVASFGDPRALARILTQLSFAHSRLAQYRQAEEVLTEAATVDREAGHRRGEASAMEALGLVRLAQWQYREAEGCFGRAVELLAEIGTEDEGFADVPRASALLVHHRARALRGQGRYGEALQQLARADELFTDLPDGPDRYNAGRALMSTGETQLDSGDLAAARATLTEAREVMVAEGAGAQEAYAAEMLGQCAEQLAETADAVGWFTLAAERFRAAGDHSSGARADARLAGVRYCDDP